MTNVQVVITLSAHRRKANLTQEELAQVVDVTRQTIISIEKGNYVPTLLLALKLSHYFKTLVKKVFSYENRKDCSVGIFTSRPDTSGANVAP